MHQGRERTSVMTYLMFFAKPMRRKSLFLHYLEVVNIEKNVLRYISIAVVDLPITSIFHNHVHEDAQAILGNRVSTVC
jgi:hypothetical protein